MKSSTDTSTLLLDVILKFSSKTNNTITDIQRKELTEYGISFGRCYDDCTHIVCYPEEYENIKLKVRSPESLYFVTPKFVTDILTYGIRFQECRYSSDPLRFLSGLKFNIRCDNCDNYQDYISLSQYYGADVIDVISQHITHIIINKDNINSEFLTEAIEKSQAIILDIEWLDQCLRVKKLVDESPYIIGRGKNTTIIKEDKYYCSWSNNLRKTMYVICKNISQFQQSLLSKYHLYFSPMIDPYKSLYLQEISSYHGAIISKTITHSTHIISYCDIYKSKTRMCLHPNWLLISIENSEVINVESDDRKSPNSPSAFEVALSRSTPQKYMKEFNQKIISVIGFSSSSYPKLYYIESAIRMLGGSVIYTVNNDYATPDYIIYNTDSDLLDFSEIENIPILIVDWIIHCLYEWKFVKQSPYLLSKRTNHLESILLSSPNDNNDNYNNERMEIEEEEEEKAEYMNNNDSIIIDNVSYNTESQQQPQQELLLSFSSPQSQDNDNNKHKDKKEKEENKEEKEKEVDEENSVMKEEKNEISNEESIIMIEEDEEKEIEKEMEKDKEENKEVLKEEEEEEEEEEKSVVKNNSVIMSSSSPETSHVNEDYTSKKNDENKTVIEANETREEKIDDERVVNENVNNKSNSSSSTSEESSVIILPNIHDMIKPQEEKSIEKETEKEKNKSDEWTVSLENENNSELNKKLNFDVSQSDNSIQYFNKQISSSNQTEDSVSPPVLPSPNKPKLYQPSIQTPIVVEKKLALTISDEVSSNEEKEKENDKKEIEKEEYVKEKEEEKKNDNLMEIEDEEEKEENNEEKEKENTVGEEENKEIKNQNQLNETHKKEELSPPLIEVEEEEKQIQPPQKEELQQQEDVEKQQLHQEEENQIQLSNTIHFTIPSQLFQTQSQPEQQPEQQSIVNNNDISQSDSYSHFIFRSNSTPIKPTNIITIEEENENKKENEEETKTSTSLKTKSKTLPTPKSKRKLKDLTQTPNKKPKRSLSSSSSKQTPPSSSSLSQRTTKQLLRQQFKNIYLLFSNSGCSEYKKKAKDLGFSVLEAKHDFSSETTHLITNEMKRTIKVLCALCSGIYILKPTFITELEANFKRNKISSIDDINVDEYEWNEKVKDINENCSKFWRSEKSRTGHGAFYNKTFVINENTIPPSDKLCEIIESGEGSAYINKIKPSNKKNYEDKNKDDESIKKIMIVENDWKLLNKYPSNLDEDVDIVLTASYILDYISHCKDVNITDYLL